MAGRASGRIWGRGRGILKQEKEELRRPGFVENWEDEFVDYQRPVNADVFKDDSLSIDDLINNISELTLENEEQQLADLYKQVKTSIKSESDLKTFMETFHEKYLENEDFIEVAAKACSKLATLEVGDVKLRNILLEFLQKDFKGAEEMKKESLSKYMNAVNFLCKIFQHLRFPDGSRYLILSVAILVLFETLTRPESSKQELQLFRSLFQECGKDLEACNSGKVDEFTENLRKKILDSSYSLLHRCSFLNALEISLNHWQPLKDDVHEFYQKELQ